MNTRPFYQEYWMRPTAPPDSDPTVDDRQSLLKDFIGHYHPLKALDAGCGNGVFTKFMTDQGVQCLGLDISVEAVSLARKKYPDLSFLCTSLEDKWPVGDESQDLVFSTEVIEHLFHVKQFFQEMNRVLKIGGHVVITTPYHGLVKNLIIVLTGFDKHFNNIEGGHIRFFTNKFLRKLMSEHGFEVVVFKYIGRVPIVAKSVVVIAEKVRGICT